MLCVYVENGKNYEPLTRVVQGYLYLMNFFFCLRERAEKSFALIVLMRDKYPLHMY